MRILVTGGAGFIGSHLARALLENGYGVRVIDNLSTGELRRIRDVLPEIEWMQADIRDAGAVARAVSGIDAVLHQAAIPSVSRSLADPVATTEANVAGTVTLLQACRDAGVGRLVLAGSSSAYGNTTVLPKVETMPPAPQSPYAVSKVAAEQFCQVFARLGYVETVCLRYFNVFGPGQDPDSPYAAVIPRFARRLLDGQPVPLRGDGNQSRDFTYVENAVQANLRALHARDASGEVINVGCGRRYTLLELIRELGEILDVEPRVDRQPPGPGDVLHSLADITKARLLLGYEPAVDFREGLRRTVAALRDSAREYVAV